MKALFVAFIALTSIAASSAAFAGRDSFQIWQQERFVKQKQAQEAEFARLRMCASVQQAGSSAGAASTTQR